MSKTKAQKLMAQRVLMRQRRSNVAAYEKEKEANRIRYAAAKEAGAIGRASLDEAAK